MTTILVAGATGNVGRELVRALTDAGEKVRALTRDPGRAVVPSGATAATGDLNEPASLRDALEGVHAVFLLSGYADMPGLLAEIRLAGADRVAVLADVLGRPLRFEAQSDDEAHAAMASEMPVEYVDAFVTFFSRGTVDESTVHGTVEEVTGRAPRTFEAWVTANVDRLR